MKLKSILLASLAAFIVTTCSGSVDDWDDAMLTIKFEVSADGELTYDIEIEGETNKTLTNQSGKEIKIPVPNGTYNIKVTAYLDGVEYATGSNDDPVVISGGNILVLIRLNVLDGPPTPIATPKAGSHIGPQTITLTSDAGTTIYYTTNGSAPNPPSGVSISSGGSFTINTQGKTTVKAIAVKDGKKSAMFDADYILSAGWTAAVENVTTANVITIKLTFDLPIPDPLTPPFTVYNISIANDGTRMGGVIADKALTRNSATSYTVSGKITRGGEIKISISGIEGFQNKIQSLQIQGYLPVWTAVAPAESEFRYEGITWGGSPSKFVAVGMNTSKLGIYTGCSIVVSSSDCITWTSNIVYTPNFQSIIWGGPAGQQKFVLGFATGGVGIRYSTDGGVTWTDITSDIFNSNIGSINNIIWGGSTGQQKFVAAGTRGLLTAARGLLAYSADGVNWTAVPTGTNAGTTRFGSSTVQGIAWGGSAGQQKFVAVGDDGKMAYSTNAIDWELVVDSGFATTAIYNITWGNDRFVAVGSGGKMAWSYNGIDNWTSIPAGTGNNTSRFGSSNINAIAYGGGYFVAVGADGKMAYSSNGTSWIAITDTTFETSVIRGITWGGSAGQQKFVVVGNDGRIAYSLAP